MSDGLLLAEVHRADDDALDLLGTEHLGDEFGLLATLDAADVRLPIVRRDDLDALALHRRNRLGAHLGCQLAGEESTVGRDESELDGRTRDHGSSLWTSDWP